jgi:hypothetical protein
MANNCTQFSVIVPFPKDMALYDAWEKQRQVDEKEAEDNDPDYEYSDWEVTWSRSGDGLWVYTDESGNVEAAAAMIQGYLNATEQDITVYMSWANTCSKPRINEFDGGGVVITQTELFWANSYDAINKATEAGVDTGNIVGA